MKPTLRLLVDNHRELRRLALTRHELDRRLDGIRARQTARDAGLALMLAAILLGVLFAFCGCAQSGAQIF
ncbi:MAG: hypothetical protein HY323_03465 [Betaproteobacteria bacterium]|nr:hypothetical protein [Betaproteobacteria bacterium]